MVWRRNGSASPSAVHFLVSAWQGRAVDGEREIVCGEKSGVGAGAWTLTDQASEQVQAVRGLGDSAGLA